MGYHRTPAWSHSEGGAGDQMNHRQDLLLLRPPVSWGPSTRLVQHQNGSLPVVCQESKVPAGENEQDRPHIPMTVTERVPLTWC